MAAKVEAAEILLRGLLHEGRVDVATVASLCADLGVALKTAQRAARRMGLRTVRVGQHASIWADPEFQPSLPGFEPEATPDAPTPALSPEGSTPPREVTPISAAPAPTAEAPIAPRTLRLHEKFRLPARLIPFGDLDFVHVMKRCSDCGSGTKFCYGSRFICPRCVRTLVARSHATTSSPLIQPH